MKAGEGAARLAGESVRYLLAGGLNTLASYALYLALLQAMDYRAAYVLAFVAGIALSFALLRHAVFARPGRPFSLLWVAALKLWRFFCRIWEWLLGCRSRRNLRLGTPLPTCWPRRSSRRVIRVPIGCRVIRWLLMVRRM